MKTAVRISNIALKKSKLFVGLLKNFSMPNNTMTTKEQAMDNDDDRMPHGNTYSLKYRDKGAIVLFVVVFVTVMFTEANSWHSVLIFCMVSAFIMASSNVFNLVTIHDTLNCPVGTVPLGIIFAFE